MNLFDFSLPEIDSEKFDTLLQHESVTIKRIISNTLSTPQTFLQDVDEWVVVLQGCAKIMMDGEAYKLKKGDTLFIPKGTEHTLLKTKKVVVWLAIYIEPSK
ncbi:Uncharacterized conserved protein [hydrothermal vent metagenome]|uniref:Uncharacterized conserved protein n=1 Tax=hydrothermal vent metagenome TaxID=652676 RepID=A0A1W1B9P2_9ZZZZ